jgi:hypothetical protein
MTATLLKQTGFIIHGSTECTCDGCFTENFVTGMFMSVEGAIEQAKQFVDSGTVRSQYSNSGIYTIRRTKFERLPDGRIIVVKRVFEELNFFETGKIADELRYIGIEVDRFGSYNTN